MNFETKARPITTVEELDAALAAGADLWFSACADSGATVANASRSHEGRNGWIQIDSDVARMMQKDPRDYRILCAFYPARRPLLSRLAFWRKAA